MIIFPMFLVGEKCASHFCKETSTKNKELKKMNWDVKLILDQTKLFRVNSKLPSLHGGSLEITLTVHLRVFN